jgi:hypothetical protein
MSLQRLDTLLSYAGLVALATSSVYLGALGSYKVSPNISFHVTRHLHFPAPKAKQVKILTRLGLGLGR